MKWVDCTMGVRGGQMKTLFVMVFGMLALFGCSGQSQDASITIEDFRFTPTRLHVIADRPLRLVVRNQGREMHQFQSRVLFASRVRVKGNSVGGQQGVAIPSGKSVELILTLPVGMYDFQCPIRGHRGMNGTIVAEPGR
jgi:uncharacterized cupredoxin-like copper-binding protein